MNKPPIFSIFFFILLAAQSSIGQNYSNIISTVSENTPDSIVFQHCLDSITKYVYLDSRKIEPYMKVCEEMLNSQSNLPNRHRLEFVIQRIYNEFNYNNTIGVMKIIENNRDMLDLSGIAEKQKNQFNYLNGYTLLILGEVESAQHTFYNLLNLAKSKKDTSLTLQSLSSLGKLFNMQNDYENAEKYTLDFLKLMPKEKTTNRANGYLELISIYLKSNQIEKADYYNKVAMQLADSLNFVDYQVDYLINEIAINLEKGNPNLALKAYEEASEIAASVGNPNYEKLCKLSYADILEYQNRYMEALSLYEQFIKDGEKGDVVQSDLLNYYKSASTVADKKGDHKKAFQYVLKANQISDSLHVQEQQEKSQYLQIKFDADQKEQENAILSAQVLQEQSQNRFLYALIALFFIGTGFLIYAFLQKRNYNKLLERDVKRRTSELVETNKLMQNTNQELSELNYILSHDLKEPLLTIVNFSDMATAEISSLDAGQKERLSQYMGYMNKSGKRLHRLIEDISHFQTIDDALKEELKIVDVDATIKTIAASSQEMLKDQEIVIAYDDLPKIHSYQNLLSIIFNKLIENGLKYNNSGKPTIQIDYKQQDDFHTFLVKDNGIGIEPEFHDRVFGMFKRLHNRNEYDGSGLGLNIVKKIVDKLGGNISIKESNLDKGSTFQVSLPVIASV